MVCKAKLKGYRTVAKIKQVLTKNGYIVSNLEKTGKFVKEKDLWNLWDLIAIKSKEHLFIQAKTNMKGHKWKEPYIKFGKMHGSKYVKYEIWNKFDRLYFEILNCSTEQHRIERFI